MTHREFEARAVAQAVRRLGELADDYPSQRYDGLFRTPIKQARRRLWVLAATSRGEDRGTWKTFGGALATRLIREYEKAHREPVQRATGAVQLALFNPAHERAIIRAVLRAVRA